MADTGLSSAPEAEPSRPAPEEEPSRPEERESSRPAPEAEASRPAPEELEASRPAPEEQEASLPAPQRSEHASRSRRRQSRHPEPDFTKQLVRWLTRCPVVWAAACAILVAGFLEMPRVVHVATSGLLAGVPWLYATVGWRHGLRLRHHSGHGHRLLASLIALVLIVAFLRTVLALNDSVIAMLQAPPPEGTP